jgi:hypothetical protein
MGLWLVGGMVGLGIAATICHAVATTLLLRRAHERGVRRAREKHDGAGRRA